MRRVTVTLPDDLEREIDEYLERAEARPSVTVLTQVALRRFLEEERLRSRSFRPPSAPLRFTTAEAADGPSDVSEHHDRYLAEEE